MDSNSSYDLPKFGQSQVTLSPDQLETLLTIDENISLNEMDERNLLQSLNFQQPNFLLSYESSNNVI